jgi:hypothetical protein
MLVFFYRTLVKIEIDWIMGNENYILFSFFFLDERSTTAFLARTGEHVHHVNIGVSY